MNNYQNQNWNHSSATANNQQNNQEQTNAQSPNNQANQQPNPLMSLVGAVLPALLEHFTGQKMTQGSSSPEMQIVLSQVISLQQQIITNQQALNNRLVNLENNAVQQFTNLTNQVQSIKSVRLTQQKETKSIDYNLDQGSQEAN